MKFGRKFGELKYGMKLRNETIFENRKRSL
jgi:hypothetical protein